MKVEILSNFPLTCKGKRFEVAVENGAHQFAAVIGGVSNWFASRSIHLAWLVYVRAFVNDTAESVSINFPLFYVWWLLKSENVNRTKPSVKISHFDISTIYLISRDRQNSTRILSVFVFLGLTAQGRKRRTVNNGFVFTNLCQEFIQRWFYIHFATDHIQYNVLLLFCFLA